MLIVFLQIPTTKTIQGCLKTKMFQVELCPGSGQYIPLTKISKHLQKTVVLTEDSSFFQHDGFDWNSLEKNAKETLEKRSFNKGGSTISQQLAKNLFLTKEKTLTRKFFEFLITWKIERVLSKRDILERYLNVVEFGKNLYGVKAAASFYFQKSAADLSVVESAFLASLLPSPVKYSKSFFQKDLSPFLRSRIGRIIKDLFQYQRITPDEYEVAVNEFNSFLNPSGASNGLALDIDSPSEDIFATDSANVEEEESTDEEELDLDN
ncbi:MAG: biosynthetic peptidoglycan transglycosylase [Bdellovibrionota bacterium]